MKWKEITADTVIKNNTTVYARRKAKKNKTKYSTKTINKIIRKVKKCKIKEVDDKWQCACGDTTKIVSKNLLSRVYNPY